MKILYGVQGTGQGHISRARAMAHALSAHPVDVTWLFSGRDRSDFFDMEPFGDFEHRRGLTFATEGGRINYLRTVTGNNFFRFLSDIRSLDLSGFDLVVTDYEPVTAWASRYRGVRCIGIGHQYAFGPTTPSTGGNPLTHLIMRAFAPVSEPLGLHWHPYSERVLPPILDLPPASRLDDNFILVYLPFEDQDAVTQLLSKLPDQRFIQYARELPPGIEGNVTRRSANIEHFKHHLATCSGVICNSGFELISECLHWQKRVLTKPLHGQMEQLSNALALEQLGYASTTPQLSVDVVERWLAKRPPAPGIEFADVAKELAHWLAGGCTESPATLSSRLWGHTRGDQYDTRRKPLPTAA
ncbi:MAG: MJ1255/VC2487 family glycosyltransferase [Halioglobus sp.]